MTNGKAFAFAAALLAAGSAAAALAGAPPLATASAALAAAVAALVAGILPRRVRGEPARPKTIPTDRAARAGAQAKPAEPSQTPHREARATQAARIASGLAAEAHVARLESEAASREARTKEAALSAASALRRLRFADAILSKVPPTTEEATFALMERLIALRDQSARAAEAAVSAESGANNATVIAEMAGHARATMKNVQNSLAEMRRHDREATSGLKALGDELKSGIELLAGIEEITERSRLIAFNMAIEAARIGEKGRGFKVIVGELRALNDRTVDFSRQVTNLLERFKGHNEDLVESAISSSLAVAEKVDAGIGEEERAIESLLGASTTCLALSDNVIETVRQMNRELDGILESLQFQDITRQMIEGAQYTVADAARDLGSLAPKDDSPHAKLEEAHRMEALRSELLARAKTKGEKEAIQEVKK